MDFFSDLSGKRVVVTGACGVVGRWIVDAFVAAGAELCLTDAQEAALSDQMRWLVRHARAVWAT